MRRRRRLPLCWCVRTTSGIVSPPCGGSSRRSSSSTSKPCSAVLPLAIRSGPRSRLAARAWRDHLRQLLLERASTAAERIAHATGVYFPNRAHSARIAVKKLRYAAEISQATGASNLQGAIKSLRKGQEVLGEIHDRASLSDTLTRYLALDHVNNDHIAQTTQVLEGEILDLHARYLARRSDIRDACAEIERLSLRGSKAGPALAVGGGILVAALAYLNNRAPQSKKPLMQVKGRLAV